MTRIILMIATALLACLMLTGCILTDRIQNPDGTFSPSPLEQTIGIAVSGNLYGAGATLIGTLLGAWAANRRQRKRGQDMLGQVVKAVGDFMAEMPNYTGMTPDQIVDAERERLKSWLSKRTDTLTKEAIRLIKARLGLGK